MRRKTARALLLFVVAAGLTLIRPTPAMALAITTVNTTAVADNPGDGKCDLYEALQAIADANAGTDIDGNGVDAYHECAAGIGPNAIVFAGPAAGGTIKLPLSLFSGLFTGLPYVTRDVTITGPVVIDGGGSAVNTHIFITNAGGRLTLDNLVVQNGYTTGGGGAILSLGGDDVINIANSSFHGNTAEGNGGAINAVGQVNIFGSNFSGNKALGKDGVGPGTDYPGQGGAIYVTGYNSLNISLTNFAGNTATEGGGAIYTTADTGQITDSVFNGNIVNDDAVTDDTQGGGAIYNGGNNPDTGLTLTRVAFNANLTFNAFGGAIYNGSSGYLHTRDTSFNGNIAGDLGHIEYGGAIYNQETLDIRRTMFLANVATRGKGGAIFNDRTGDAFLASTTLTANGAPDNTNGEGGAIWNGNTQPGGPASTVHLYNVTFSMNVSPNNGAAIFNETGGSHTVTLANTLIDGLPLIGDTCNTALTSQGHNLEGSDKCGLHQPTDQPGGSPGLETIGYNGGPLTSLLTHALAPGSDAIDAGDDAVCSNQYVENLDQRSEPRPKPLHCDIGAFETDPLIAGAASDPIPPGPIDIGNTSQGTPITNTLTVYDVGNVPLELSIPLNVLLITGLDASEFEMVTPMPVSTSTSYKIILRCKATTQGHKVALLTMKTNVPNLPVVAWGLECTVNAAPTPSFASDPDVPGPLDFGQVQVGMAKGLNLKYFETGNATLTLGAISITGPNAAEFTHGVFDQSLSDGDAAANLTVTCTPTGFGLRTATLAFTTNDPGLASASFNLVCDGLPPPPKPLAEPGTSYIDGAGSANNLGGAYDVALSPDGLNVYVTSYDDDSLTVFRRNAVTGQLTFVMDSVIHSDMNGPAMVEVSPDGTQVYVTAILGHSFLIFPRNAATGIVGSASVWTQGDAGITGLDYPYGIAVSPDGRFIYVTGFTNDAIVRFYRDSDGFVGFDGQLIDHTHLKYPYVPVISPDGKNLYVTGGATGGTPTAGYVTAYKRNSLDGTLNFLQQRNDGDACGLFCTLPLSGAWGIDVTPDGQYVYVAAHNENAVVAFRRAFSGTLTYAGRVIDTAALNTPDAPEAVDAPDTTSAIGLAGVIDVKVSPDGVTLYAAGHTDNAVVVFSRNTSTGGLTSVQNIVQASPSPALGGARALAVSLDGTTVYAAASAPGAVVAFHAANPVATLSTLLPASTAAGTPFLTVRVQGLQFVPGSVVRVNGADRETLYVHPQELQVKLLASDLAAAGAKTLTVFNPVPGGGASLNSKTFTVTAPASNPVPSIDSLTPGGATGGDPTLVLTIWGANFLPNSTVKWNGVTRAKTFVSSGKLQINVTAADMQSPGTAVVTVQNPGPGGGSSNAVGFNVAGPNKNPVPTLTSITPKFTNAHGAGSSPFKVRVQGTKFMQGTQGQWNGQNRPTQTINSTTIEITLTGAEVAFGGTGAVTVVNPGPGGGPSNALPFTIYPVTIYIPLMLR